MKTSGIYLFLLAIIITTGCTYSQTSTSKDHIQFRPIPFGEADIFGPGRGACQWHNGSEAVTYNPDDSLQQPHDVYFRFTWNRLEDSTQGSYNWTFFDELIREAINKGQKLSFGIMSCYGDKTDGVIEYDGGFSAYPFYLHKLMQAEDPSSRDWLTDEKTWVPNWNSPHYLGRLRALHEALYEHILASTFTPSSGPLKGQAIPFSNAIYCIDVRGYGNYGEWHSSGLVDHVRDYPEGRRATATSLKTIIDHHTQVFDRWPLMLMIAAFDAEQVGNIMNPVEVGHYALTTRNKWGPLGWRRDQWGATDGYLDDILKHNRKSIESGQPLRELIKTRFLSSPVTGEPPRYVNRGGHCAYWDLERQVEDYGASSIGDGNWGVKMDDCAIENAKAAFRQAGYRILIEGGSLSTDTLVPGQPFSITLKWKNIGVAPTYEPWDVLFQIANEKNELLWVDTSAFRPRLFNPQDEYTAITDSFIAPATLPAGIHTLSIILKDPLKYRSPLPLAIKGRKPDGSYLIAPVNVISKQ